MTGDRGRLEGTRVSEDGEGAAIRYVPAVAAEWDLDAPGNLHRELDATMCFVDISGFTNLSERLARRGRIGAEELTEVLNRVFGSMLELAYARGGVLLKFGGDALLLMFRGVDHPVQACNAATARRRPAASNPDTSTFNACPGSTSKARRLRPLLSQYPSVN